MMNVVYLAAVAVGVLIGGLLRSSVPLPLIALTTILIGACAALAWRKFGGV